MNTDNMMMCFPMRVHSYDSATQMAEIIISAESLYSDSTVTDKTTPRQLIRNVPVFTISGGTASLQMPIAKGDTGMISFSQIGYDHWIKNDLDAGGTLAGIPVPHLKRAFNAKDGFAFVGFRTLPRALAAAAANALVLQNAGSSLTLAAGAAVLNDGTQDLGATIVGALSTLQTTIDNVASAVLADSGQSACVAAALAGSDLLDTEILKLGGF